MLIYHFFMWILDFSFQVVDSFEFSTPTFIYNWAEDMPKYLQVVRYVLPIHDLFPLIEAIIALSLLRIAVAVVRFVIQIVRG